MPSSGQVPAGGWAMSCLTVVSLFLPWSMWALGIIRAATSSVLQARGFMTIPCL